MKKVLLNAGTIALLLSCNPSEPDKSLSSPGAFALTSDHDPFPCLMWSGSPGAETYMVFRAEGSARTFSDQAICTTTQTMYIDRTIEPATTYYYKVQAHNSSTTSPFSEVLSFTSAHLLVLFPTAQDTFAPGDTVTVTLSGFAAHQAGINLGFGKHIEPVLANSFLIQDNPTPRCRLPEFFVNATFNSQTNAWDRDTLYLNSDSCYIQIYSYHNPSDILAESEYYFSVIAP